MADRVSVVSDVPAPRIEPDEERSPLAWWQLRGWRIDRNILMRVRDGLQALAPAPAPAAQAPLSRDPGPAPAAEGRPPGAPPARAPPPAALPPGAPAADGPGPATPWPGRPTTEEAAAGPA